MNSNVFISNRKNTQDSIQNLDNSLSEKVSEERENINKDDNDDLSVEIQIPIQNGEISSEKAKTNIFTCKKISSKEPSIPKKVNTYNSSTNLNAPLFSSNFSIEKISNFSKNENRFQRYTEGGKKNLWNMSTYDGVKKKSVNIKRTFTQNEQDFEKNLSVDIDRLTSAPKINKNIESFKTLNTVNHEFKNFGNNNIRKIPQDEPQKFQGNFNNEIINNNYNSINNVANGGFNSFIKNQNINNENIRNNYRERYLTYQNEQSQLNGNNLISVKRIPYKNITDNNIKTENLNPNLNLNSNNNISQTPRNIQTSLQPIITYQKYDNGNTSIYNNPQIQNNNNNLSNTQEIKTKSVNKNNFEQILPTMQGYASLNGSRQKTQNVNNANNVHNSEFSLEMNMNGNNVTNLNNAKYLIPERKTNNATGFQNSNVMNNYPNPTQQNMIVSQQQQIAQNRNVNINLNNQNFTQNLTQNITQINYGNMLNQNVPRGTVVNQELPRSTFINNNMNQNIARGTVYNQQLQRGPNINQNITQNSIYNQQLQRGQNINQNSDRGTIYNQSMNRPTINTQNIGKEINQDLSRSGVVKKLGHNMILQQNRNNTQIISQLRTKQINNTYENNAMNLSSDLVLNQNNYSLIGSNTNEQITNNENLNINNIYVNGIRTITKTKNPFLNNNDNNSNNINPINKKNTAIINKLNNQTFDQQQRNTTNNITPNPTNNLPNQRLTVTNQQTPFTQNQNIQQNVNQNYEINRNTISINTPETPTPTEQKKDIDITYSDFDGSGYIKNYGGVSRAGSDENGIQKTNQDSLVSITNINGIKDFNIFGVLDGHGTEGHLISQLISKFIPDQIINDPEIKPLKSTEQIYEKLLQNNYLIIKNAYQLADNHLATTNEIDCSSSGTTCVLVIQVGTHIICSNAGDSRAIIAYDQNSSQELNFLCCEPLSTDYKPEIPEEKIRIINNGGIVEQLKGSNGLGIGPYRVFVNGKEYPGLAMSRSIGDVQAKTVGCVPIPGIMECDISDKTKFVVICSDGVWEFLSNEFVAALGKSFYLRNDASGFCHELVKESLKQWNEEDVMVDDITVVVCFF